MPKSLTTIKPGTIITDKVLLLASIEYYEKQEKLRAENLHQILLSLLCHTARTGNPDMLNRMFAGLNTNDARAFRYYVDRFQYVSEDGKPGVFKRDPDTGERILSDMSFLDFDRKGFRLMGGVMPNRERFMKHAEEHLIRPSAEYPPFYRISNTRQQRADMIGNMALIKKAKGLLASVKKAMEAEGSTVNPRLAKVFTEFGDKLETIADQFSDDDDKAMYEGVKRADVNAATLAIAHGMEQRLASMVTDDETTDDAAEDTATPPPANDKVTAGTGRRAAAH